MGTAPASAREALDMVRAGLGYLASADAGQLSAATQAGCLRELERDAAVLTAARAGILASFTAGQGYADDADYSAVSWLIHRTGITKGAAVGHTAWAKRSATHPRVLAALAAGQVTEPVGRLICLWTGKLPEQFRDDADEVLMHAQALGACPWGAALALAAACPCLGSLPMGAALALAAARLGQALGIPGACPRARHAASPRIVPHSSKIGSCLFPFLCP